jgi:hypothetical protein
MKLSKISVIIYPCHQIKEKKELISALLVFEERA